MPDVNFTAAIYGLWNNNYDGGTNITPPRCGMFFRSNSYVYETLCKFDVSSLAGKTIDSAYLQFTVTGYGSGTVPNNVAAMEQNKTNPTGWSTPPVYDDFGNYPGTHTDWDTLLNSVSGVRDIGTYTIVDSGDNIKNLVQSWIDNTADNWGLVLQRNDSTITRYLVLGTVKIFISYTDSATAAIFRRRLTLITDLE